MLTTVRRICGRIMHSQTALRSQWDKGWKNNSQFASPSIRRPTLKKELSECTGIFKGGRRKELQQEIESIDNQISNMKKRFSSIVREYKFDSVQAFYKELNVAKSTYLDYQADREEYEKIYGEKTMDSMSIRDRIRQKEQMVKETQTRRAYQARQKNKGAR